MTRLDMGQGAPRIDVKELEAQPSLERVLAQLKNPDNRFSPEDSIRIKGLLKANTGFNDLNLYGYGRTFCGELAGRLEVEKINFLDVFSADESQVLLRCSAGDKDTGKICNAIRPNGFHESEYEDRNWGFQMENGPCGGPFLLTVPTKDFIELIEAAKTGEGTPEAVAQGVSEEAGKTVET